MLECLHMPGPEGDISERAKLRFEVWKAVQGRKAGDTRDYDRLPREQALGCLFELAIKRPDYLQGGITNLAHDFPFPPDGLLNPLGVGAFIQVYIDETIGYNDKVRDKGKSLSSKQYKEWWHDLGFKHFGNSEKETQQLLQWMQEHPEEVVECFSREWKLAQEYSGEFLKRAKKGKLKRISF